MRILITNNTLSYLAGSELYVYDLARELKRQGHDVTCFSLTLGLVAERLRDEGIEVTDTLAGFPPDSFDVVHAHHTIETRVAAAHFPMTPLVHVSHGATHPLERPGRLEAAITRYVAVSDEVRRALIMSDGVPEQLIDLVPNFVDTNRFHQRRSISTNAKRALVVSNHYGLGATKETVEEAGRLANLELRVIGGPNSVWNVEDYIDWADVVIALGRGALQAMAMGRAVVVYDYRGGDGLVTPDTFDEFAECNFSGRKHGRRYTPRELADLLRSYRISDVESVRQLVCETRSVGVISKRLVEIYSAAIEQHALRWPASQPLEKTRAVLQDMARFVADQKPAAARLADLEWLAGQLAEREQQVASLTVEREELRRERAALAARLAETEDLLRRVANGRVMRLLNGMNRVAQALFRR